MKRTLSGVRAAGQLVTKLQNQTPIEGSLTCLGVLRANASVAVEAGWAAAAYIADMRWPAVDALNPGEAGPAGACGRHVGSRKPNRESWETRKNSGHCFVQAESSSS